MGGYISLYIYNPSNFRYLDSQRLVTKSWYQVTSKDLHSLNLPLKFSQKIQRAYC